MGFILTNLHSTFTHFKGKCQGHVQALFLCEDLPIIKSWHLANVAYGVLSIKTAAVTRRDSPRFTLLCE